MLLLGSLLLTVLIAILLTQYPFYVKKYKPKKYASPWAHSCNGRAAQYVGIWYTIGEINKTPIRALVVPLVYLIGGLIYIFFIQ